MPRDHTGMSPAPHLTLPAPDPDPTPGCDICAALARERAAARANGDPSRATDCNVELRHHPRRHPLSARHLFGPAFTPACHTLRTAHPDLTADLAERAVTEAIKFVATCARNTGLAMSAPPLIAAAWHALRRHPAAYEALCAHFGPYIHAFPLTPHHHARTRALVHATGFRPDPELWRRPAD
ncbi:hypothetical protein LG634_15155 [Streptomyces bambusae]|uniref:hypothetical protein n=1 Tax=Streptomyces bambusae TaxID=1550616 RepID=UPI001CFE9036|nr:hypothetical protein [Streptomyces bambusae]MCB5166166.1 hypothetical protein [Streptomyces bambusae]